MKTITDEQIADLITDEEIKQSWYELFTSYTGNIEDNKKLFTKIANEFLREQKIDVTVKGILTVTEDGEVTWIL